MGALKGSKQTAEHIEKRKHTFFKKGHSVPKEWRAKLSQLNKTSIGDKARNWQGGKPHCVDCGKELANRKAKRCQQCLGKIRIPFFKGKKLSEELKEKISKSTRLAMRRPEVINKLSGENSWNWKGGLSRIPYPIEWRNSLKEKIRERDSGICQKCGCSQLENIHRLTIHHIDYNKSNLSEANLITLCKSCNSKVNFNREYWTGYFTKLLLSKISFKW